ncbi:ABC transporter ATP-binding protein [Natronospora cellulosivora (SeqCode)]
MKNQDESMLYNNFYVLKMVHKIHPQRIYLEFIKYGLDNFRRIFYGIIFIRYLLESMEGNRSFSHIVIFIIISASVFMFVDFYNKWFYNYFKPISDNIIYENVYQKLYDKAEKVELSCYEDKEFYNNYTVAMEGANEKITQTIENCSKIIFAALAVTYVFYTMFNIDPWVLLFVIFPIIGNFVIGKKLNKIYYQRYIKSVPFQRRMEYVNRIVYLKEFAKEIRLSNIFTVMKDIYNEGYEGVLKVIESMKTKAAWTYFLKTVTSFMFLFEGVLLYGAYRAIVTQSITLSEFAILSSAMVSGAWMIIDVAERMVSIYENGMFLNKLKDFLNYRPKIIEKKDAKKVSRPVNSIVFENLKFAYKDEDYQLKSLNIKINKKAKIAIVGQNGAGKSTFVKLLMRLYDPTEGRIMLNGRNIKDYKLQNYRNLYGATFQDYQIFSMTVAENVLMKKVETVEEKDRVIGALEKSGIYKKVERLPNGIDTVLTKEFDKNGAVLSGGEMQKIAIARAIANDYEIVILDEPTSALDPVAEYYLYQNIMETCKDKIVIFISHRLSSAILADHIYMMEDGRIIEEGNHKQLISINGKYAEMFNKQAEKFREDNMKGFENAGMKVGIKNAR